MGATILKVHIENFRCFKRLDYSPQTTNVLVGPNNIGKTALLHAIALVLNPVLHRSPNAITEHDFYRRLYLPTGTAERAPAVEPTGESATVGETIEDGDGAHPEIVVEITLGPLMSPEEKSPFCTCLEGWNAEHRCTVSMEDDESALDHYPNCVRIAFVAWYDSEEDDFFWQVVHPYPDDGTPLREKRRVRQDVLRSFGFLMYHDYRASNRPLTLSPKQIFHKLLTAYSAKPHTYEVLLENLRGTGTALHDDPEFSQVVSDFHAEIERFLPFRDADNALRFDVTDMTRSSIREATQAFVENMGSNLLLPLETYGAGTRSITTLASLTLFARRRGHGILAIEEPETFLYPASQRAVIREVKSVATQLFLTTHSPYVLDLFEPDEIRVMSVNAEGIGAISDLHIEGIKDHSRYYKVLRSGLSEAMLSPRALLVEGASDAPIVRGFSELSCELTGVNFACDLNREGIAVVECQGVGEISRIATFLDSAGVQCSIMHDTVSDGAEQDQLDSAPGKKFDIGYSGIEALLANELPEYILREILDWATTQEGLKAVPNSPPAGMTAEQVVEATLKLLAKNKRTPALYADLLARCKNHAACPATFQSIFRSLAGTAAPTAAEDAPATGEGDGTDA
jgi:putative ATP-dependent endonuclease of the OLD family